MEPAMASEDNRDVSLQPDRPPTAQAALDLEHHRNLKQAAAACGGHAARSKNLRQQQ
jgi:hypothetical protein